MPAPCRPPANKVKSCVVPQPRKPAPHRGIQIAIPKECEWAETRWNGADGNCTDFAVLAAPLAYASTRLQRQTHIIDGMLRGCLRVLLWVPLIPLLAAADDGLPPAATTKVDFARDIAPLFEQRCFMCHGPRQQMSGLRLDQKAAALKGGRSGAVIVPHDSAGSRLIRLVAGVSADKKVMPPMGARLTAAEIGLLRAWIDQGVEWPESVTAVSRPSHWAFQKIARPEPPAVRNRAWPRNAIDDFVLAKLESESIAPSPEAARSTLIRRVSLDLTGLPPSPDEVRDFLGDNRPDAYERAVDRLLDSPHYGENGAATGWISRVTPIPTAMRRTARVPGRGATASG